MKTGGIRKLNIPPSLWSTGTGGTAAKLPKDATLEFDIELIGVKQLTIIDKVGQTRFILGVGIVLIGIYEYISGTFAS
jgi:hypothetical protein